MSAPNAPSVHGTQARTAAARNLIGSRQRLAQAASEGYRWAAHEDNRVYAHLVVVQPGHIRYMRRVADCDDGGENDRAAEYSGFIADNDPTYVLSLLGILERLLDDVAMHSTSCDCPACEAADRTIDLLLKEGEHGRT